MRRAEERPRPARLLLKGVLAAGGGAAREHRPFLLVGCDLDRGPPPERSGVCLAAGQGIRSSDADVLTPRVVGACRSSGITRPRRSGRVRQARSPRRSRRPSGCGRRLGTLARAPDEFGGSRVKRARTLVGARWPNRAEAKRRSSSDSRAQRESRGHACASSNASPGGTSVACSGQASRGT